MSHTKLILLGTGTPNAEANHNGPASAVVVDGQAYLVDFGPGVVRQCTKAFEKGIDALRPDKLNIAFCTHLHTDHTTGLADLIFTPWVLERKNPLQLYGPEGLKDMAMCIEKAYSKDIDMRLNGDEPANETGYKTIVKEFPQGIKDYGILFEDEHVKVNAFTVDHGRLQSVAYKFITEDKTIVISGDTKPTEIIIEKSKGADILLHECEYAKGLSKRSEQWQIYHKNVHTLSTDLGKMVAQANPKKVVTYHRIYHRNMLDNTIHLEAEMQKINDEMTEEIRTSGYDGEIYHGNDLDIYE